jgi:hypothetical protein
MKRRTELSALADSRSLGEPNWFVGRTFAEEVNWMKNWMTQRIAWIDRQFVAAPALSEKEGSVRAERNLRCAPRPEKFTTPSTAPIHAYPAVAFRSRRESMNRQCRSIKRRMSSRG